MGEAGERSVRIAKVTAAYAQGAGARGLRRPPTALLGPAGSVSSNQTHPQNLRVRSRASVGRLRLLHRVPGFAPVKALLPVRVFVATDILVVGTHEGAALVFVVIGNDQQGAYIIELTD